ncbi:hypothetical protein EVJ58_g11028, partial [Rhodofomes roseus]
LALTSGQSEFSHSPPHIKPLFPYSSFPPAFAYAPAHSADIRSEPAAKRQRTRYHLDVGAYGIPKRSHGASIAGRDGNGRFAFEDAFPPSDRTGSLGRAVQVGEDAYFVRDNAMGVADGVGGWSKHRRTELEDSLEDLEDGLDVLMILEKAFQKTMEDHVGEAPHTPTEKASDATADSSPRSTSKADDAQASSPTSSPSPARQARSPSPKRPLVEGSSTALVAVLEHPRTRAKQARPLQLFGPSPRPSSQGPAVSERGAMLTIAHLGDCMGMLIRGEDIVWRTEEMWWNFNTPVQLGPASPTRPRDAQVFRIPVQADDILILASDGLSDNLWDEDVLDEVIRFRRPFLADGSWSTPAPAQASSGRSTLAAMLSEALCSRARRAAERREGKGVCDPELEVPFARRARELGRSFHGGKPDDISVLVAVVSPAEAKRS